MFFKWLKAQVLGLLGSKISHTLRIGSKANLFDGDEEITMAFDPYYMLSRHSPRALKDDDNYIRVSNKASSDDDFVMEKDEDTGDNLVFSVGDYRYIFCKTKFTQYFPSFTGKLFIKLLS